MIVVERWRRRLSALLLRARQRSVVVDVTSESVNCFRTNRLSQVAALLTYYGFWSVFPLMLCFTTVLGWILQDNEELQESIVDSALSRIPVIGPQLKLDASALTGSGPVFVIALLTAIWAGLKVFVIAQFALDDIEGLPRRERTGSIGRRLRALATIAIVGLALVVSAVVSALLSASKFAMLAQIGLLTVTLVFNIGLIMVTYRLLTTKGRPWLELLPGSIAVGVIFFVLQVFGSLVVGRAITRATPVYGTFATVIGLMTWILVHSIVALVGYQFTVVLARRKAGSFVAGEL